MYDELDSKVDTVRNNWRAKKSRFIKRKEKGWKDK